MFLFIMDFFHGFGIWICFFKHFLKVLLILITEVFAPTSILFQGSTLLILALL